MPSFSLLNPPPSLVEGDLNEEKRMPRWLPMAGLFCPELGKGGGGDSPPNEMIVDMALIGRHFAYLVLLSQNLEVTLRKCLVNMQLFALSNGQPNPFARDPRTADLFTRVKLFEGQLDMSDPGSRELVGRLHRARKLRNDFIHAFYDLECSNLVSAGGRKKLIHRLELSQRLYFGLVGLIQQVELAYADDLGMTAMLEEMMAKDEREKAEAEQVIDELLEGADAGSECD